MRIDEGEEKETTGCCGFDDCIIRMLDRRRFNLLHRDLERTFVIYGFHLAWTYFRVRIVCIS